MAKISFEPANSLFYSSLKESVGQHFINGGIKSTGNIFLHIKLFTLVPAATGIYILLIFGNLNPLLASVLCALEGLILALIGFNVMHDACHGSYSDHKWINNLLGHSMNALGGNAFIWKQKHNIVHHTYTNVDGIDDDIAKLPVIRQCPSQKWQKAHKYQYLYMFVVYALSTFLWVTMMDFAKYFSSKIYNTTLQKMQISDHFIFWLSKVLYLVFYILIPVYFVGFSAWIIGFFIMHIFMGLALALVFQLAHVVESTHFVDGNSLLSSEDEWAVHQVKTTSNFATKNKFITWCVGGLNFQVEHHLFPKISHVHYPAISKLVQLQCEKFGIEYHNYPTLVSALSSHVRFMKHLGKP